MESSRETKGIDLLTTQNSKTKFCQIHEAYTRSHMPKRIQVPHNSLEALISYNLPKTSFVWTDTAQVFTPHGIDVTGNSMLTDI